MLGLDPDPAALWPVAVEPGAEATGGKPEGEPDPAALTASCSDAARGAEAVAGLARAGVRIADFSLGQPSLDEVFLALTDKPAVSSASQEAVA